jgi:hypothetical protein
LNHRGAEGIETSAPLFPMNGGLRVMRLPLVLQMQADRLGRSAPVLAPGGTEMATRPGKDK